METTKDKEHSLELKVMRLTRPTMSETIPVTCDPRDLPGYLLNQQLKQDLAAPIGLEKCNLGNLLILPQSFGTIYLGETFSCYMSVHNDSQSTISDVMVKVDLQTSTQKLSLTGAGSNRETLEPDQSIDDVIYHEVKECGTHILVCSVTYKDDKGQMLNFRKFFKFRVSKPLDVKTKFYNAESDEVYLEAQLQNITASPICLETVSLEPSQHFTVCNLNLAQNNKSVFGSINCLNPSNSRQYLFCLKPKPEAANNVKLLKGVTAIGKLDIIWRSAMGEKGRLQTSQLERMPPGYADIQVYVDEIPSLVQIEKPFQVALRITNTCERSMELVLSLENSFPSGILWQGISGIALGKLEPEKTLTLKLEAIPIHPGLKMLSGIRLTDTFLKRIYPYDALAQVFVSPDDCSELLKI